MRPSQLCRELSIAKRGCRQSQNRAGRPAWLLETTGRIAREALVDIYARGFVSRWFPRGGKPLNKKGSAGDQEAEPQPSYSSTPAPDPRPKPVVASP